MANPEDESKNEDDKYRRFLLADAGDSCWHIGLFDLFVVLPLEYLFQWTERVFTDQPEELFPKLVDTGVFLAFTAVVWMKMAVISMMWPDYMGEVLRFLASVFISAYMTSLLAFLYFVVSSVTLKDAALMEFLLTWRYSGCHEPKGLTLIQPGDLMYSQDSIQCTFRSGRWAGRSVYDTNTVDDWDQRSVVCEQTWSGQDARIWTDSHRILACFHTVPGEKYARLFALNNQTLFNARHNSGKVSFFIQVHIVPKPSDWDRRFTAKKPWRSIHVREEVHPSGGMFHQRADRQHALRIRVDVFPSIQPNMGGDVVLEVRNLVNAKKGKPLFALLQNMCRDTEITINIQQVEGDRAYARVRVSNQDEALVRSMIKAIGQQRDKKLSVHEVDGTRSFASPRD